jgi:hypothetical protein
MKLKIIPGLILLACTFSCKKETHSDALTGKWRTTRILYTNNSMSGPLYIQFIWPGKVQSTFFSKCTGYSASSDGLTLKFTGAEISQASYMYNIRQDTLTLYPIECSGGGCNLTFVKE